jgi:hypothetical protein
VIPFLVSLLEHALRQLDAPRPFPCTDMAKTIRKRSKEIGDSAEVAFAMKSVVSFTEDHYQQYNAQFSDKVGIRRGHHARTAGSTKRPCRGTPPLSRHRYGREIV